MVPCVSATSGLTQSQLNSSLASYLGTTSSYPLSDVIQDEAADIVKALISTSDTSLYSLLDGSIFSAFAQYVGDSGSDTPFWSNGVYLNQDGGYSSATGMISVTDFIRMGFRGVGKGLDFISTQINSEIDLLTALSGSVDGVATESTLDRLRGYLVLNSGATFLNSSGEVGEATVDRNFMYVLRNGFLGLRAQMALPSGTLYLAADGTSVTESEPKTLNFLLRNGFRGLATRVQSVESAINGGSGNDYVGTLIDNSNVSSDVSFSGIGQLLNTYLQEIQHDTGLLTYVFASPEDLALKSSSSDLVTQTTESFFNDDPASIPSSMTPSDLGGLSQVSGTFSGFLDTNVSPSAGFSELDDPSRFDFFTSTTAGNLDTTVSLLSVGDPARDVIVTDYYEQSRDDFSALIEEVSE